MYLFPVPIAFSKHKMAEGIHLLAADIGATKTDMALYKTVSAHNLVDLKTAVYSSKEWNSLEEMIQDFLANQPLPNCMSIAIAGPVQNRKCKVTNLDWTVDIQDLKKKFSLESIFLLNDLEANAYGLAALQQSDLITIYKGSGDGTGNAAIISPGTGLGEAGLYWDGHHLHPFATEGGHTDFGPRNELDTQLVQYLFEKYTHISWERVVSGPGIYTIDQFLRDVRGMGSPGLLEVEVLKGNPAAAISKAAEQDCTIAKTTMNIFIRYLAEEASNLALKLKATGGVFMGGGILPKIWNDRYQKIFLLHFFKVGRLRPLIESVPVHIILNSKTALLGAAYFGAHTFINKEVPCPKI